jgi:hypothetical protein
MGNTQKNNIQEYNIQQTTCQFQIKFIAKDYLQMYKTLQLNTSTFTF